MIEKSEISVIVQGAVSSDLTKTCLNSVRKELPGAEIILSTWEGSDVSNLNYDQVLFNKDPGGFTDKRVPWFTNNCSRMILSSKNGCLAAGNPYILKIRTDVEMLSADFLKHYNDLPRRSEEYFFFNHRLLCSSYFFKKYADSPEMKSMPTPFHIGDWFQFGLSEDMKKLYNIPLPKEPDFTDYFLTHPYHSVRQNLFAPCHRLTPEQYLLLTALQKDFPELKMETVADYNTENIIQYEKIVANNFIILDPHKWNIRPLKSPYSDWYDKDELPKTLVRGLFDEEMLLKDYKKYIIGEQK